MVAYEKVCFHFQISDFIAEQFGSTLRDPTEKMFFATAGRGTEMFLATEIQDKIHRFTSGQNSNLNAVCCALINASKKILSTFKVYF